MPTEDMEYDDYQTRPSGTRRHRRRESAQGPGDERYRGYRNDFNDYYEYNERPLDLRHRSPSPPRLHVGHGRNFDDSSRPRARSNPNQFHMMESPIYNQPWDPPTEPSTRDHRQYAPPQVRFESAQEQSWPATMASGRVGAFREPYHRPDSRPIVRQHTRRYSSSPNTRAGVPEIVEPPESGSTYSRAVAGEPESILRRSKSDRTSGKKTRRGDYPDVSLESVRETLHANPRMPNPEKQPKLYRDTEDEYRQKKEGIHHEARDSGRKDRVDFEQSNTQTRRPSPNYRPAMVEDYDGESSDAFGKSGKSHPHDAGDKNVPHTLKIPTIEIRNSSGPTLDQPSLRDTPDERDRLRHGLSSPPNASPSIYSRGSTSSIPSVAPTTPYEYRKLGDKGIRLLRLLPRSMSSVKCELVNTHLEQPSFPYTALSYTWGDTDNTEEIHIDGHRHKITASLHSALRRLRRHDESVYIWADAVCINQHDKEELSQQVRYMAGIFLHAEYVAIWLGPEADDSHLALELARKTSKAAHSSSAVRNIIRSKDLERHFAALVALFERPYWKRLWVVQEVLCARTKIVYCGNEQAAWEDLTTTSEAFERHKADINSIFPSGLTNSRGASRQQLAQPLHSYARILGSRGPASFNALQSIHDDVPRTLLEVMHTCRTKLCADPRDKLFAILGVLPASFGKILSIDYNASVKEVYTNVADYLIHSDKSLDVICEAIYFPLHASNFNLPTWVPDWSHVPQTGALGLSYDFNASGGQEAKLILSDDRSKLTITAIQLDTVAVHGVAMGTLCTLDDYLMAFLHWRAKLLANEEARNRFGDEAVDDMFCRTLRLGQEDPKLSGDWTAICFHIYASLLRERLRYITLDKQLIGYANKDVGVEPEARRGILHDNCNSRMTGRCFFVTKSGLIGLGTGFMDVGDVVCIPLGCKTPVLLREEGRHGEYRLVGDCYVDGFMQGEALRSTKFETRSFILH